MRCRPRRVTLASFFTQELDMNLAIEPALRACALLAGALVVGMLAIFIFTGIGQDPLQYVHPAADYMRLLLRDPSLLRATIGLDNLFIMAYSTVFVLMACLLWRSNGPGAPRVLVVTALSLLVLLGLLDMIENFHFLAMLSGAEQGLPPSDGEIRWQAVESMFKFHVSYLGLLLLGLALPRADRRQRVLAGLLVFVQWPVGVGIYVLPGSLAVPLIFVRFAFFLAAFGLLASIHGRSPRRIPGRPLMPAAGGSDVPA
jgi:hypothetical protein